MQFTKSHLINNNGIFRQIVLKAQYLGLVEYKSKDWHKLALFLTLDGENIAKLIVIYDAWDTKEYFFVEEKQGVLQIMEAGFAPTLTELDKELLDRAVDIVKNINEEINKSLERALSKKMGRPVRLNKPFNNSYERQIHTTNEKSYFDRFFDLFSRYI